MAEAVNPQNARTFDGGLIRNYSTWGTVTDVSMLVSGIQNPKELRKILESEHPYYFRNKKLWMDLLDVYLGENMERFIYRHMREREIPWKKRQERAYFFNYVQSIVDIISSFIFSRTVQRHWQSAEEREETMRDTRYNQALYDYQKNQIESQTNDQQAQAAGQGQEVQQPPDQSQQPSQSGETIPDALLEERVKELIGVQEETFGPIKEFWEDVDLRGTSINDYMKLLFLCAQVWGSVDVFMDMPSIPDGEIVKSERDRKRLQLRPYMFPIFPLDLLNWELGPDGKFEWIRWKEPIIGEIGPFDQRPEKVSYRYYTWTREEYYVHEIRFPVRGNTNDPVILLKSRGENPIGEVPLVRIFNKKHLTEPSYGVSAVRDIAKINIEIFNLASLIDEEVYQKCLNILVMQSPAEKKASIEIGANNVLLWEGDHPPYYVAPASEPGNFMLELIQRCIEEIYRIAKLGGDTGVGAQEAKSGVAYGWEFNQTNRMLADKADMMERGEIDIHRLWCKWMGYEWDGVIDYSDDYNIERYEDEVKRAMDAKQSIRSPEFKRALEKKLAARGLPKMNPVERARINAEIDVLPEEKPFMPFGQQ